MEVNGNEEGKVRGEGRDPALLARKQLFDDLTQRNRD